jgi:hypothetical protein
MLQIFIIFWDRRNITKLAAESAAKSFIGGSLRIGVDYTIYGKSIQTTEPFEWDEAHEHVLYMWSTMLQKVNRGLNIPDSDITL